LLLLGVLVFIAPIILPQVLEQTEATHSIGSGSSRLVIKTPFPDQAGIVSINGVPFRTDSSGSVRVTYEGIHSGTLLIIRVTPEIIVDPVVPGTPSGERISFSRWNDLGTRNVRNVGLTVNQSLTLVATYDKEFFLQLSSEFGNPNGAGWHRADTGVTIWVDTPISTGPGIRKSLKSWGGDIQSVNPIAVFVMDSPKVVRAQWVEEFKLTIKSLHGLPKGEGWYEGGSFANVDMLITTVDVDPSVRVIFTGWSGDTVSSSPKTSIFMDTPSSITANWKTQFYLQIVNGLGIVNEDSQWLDEGDNIIVTATSPATRDPNESRIVFTGWSGSSTSKEASVSLTMDTFKKINANWKNQFMVSVQDTTGNIRGGGWHDENASITFEADLLVETEDESGRRVRSQFRGWSGSASSQELSVTLLVDEPKVVKANWDVEYYLKVNSDLGETSGEGWYQPGETAKFSVNSPLGFLIRDVVDGWTGDTQVKAAEGTIMMDSPKVITATWRKDFIQLFITVGALVAAGIGAVAVLKRSTKVPHLPVKSKKKAK